MFSYVYFIGIGGIGMSALARFFLQRGAYVAGYDRTRTAITIALEQEGCNISYIDSEDSIPPIFRNANASSLVVFTPAIPCDNKIMLFFSKQGIELFKRAEILGKLSNELEVLAVAGTHGKTTVSTMTSHILRSSGVDCNAFLGGISKNYNSNYLCGSSSFTIMEADEFDRSFHRLSPQHALITSTDADHLDIYGNVENMLEAYSQFIAKIKNGGTLIFNSKIKNSLSIPSNISHFTYGFDSESDYKCTNIRPTDRGYTFDLQTPVATITDIEFNFLGITNVENFTAAAALALQSGVATEEGIRLAASTFEGVKRRFDVRYNNNGITYIDDYAHHPEEIKSCIESLIGFFGHRKITAIFQPHLFSRTADHAAGFARELDKLDEVILLPIYPAREKPIEGVTSDLILNAMQLPNRQLLQKEELIDFIDPSKIDVLITIGAGDIDTLTDGIVSKLSTYTNK